MSILSLNRALNNFKIQGKKYDCFLPELATQTLFFYLLAFKFEVYRV